MNQYLMPYKLFYVLLSTTESEDQGQVVWGKLSLAQIAHGASCLHSFEDMYTQVCSSYVHISMLLHVTNGLYM